MPIYEWQCLNCNKTYETIQSMNDPPPKCESKECEEDTNNMTRLLSVGSFILKGDGWYKDGYTKKTKEKNE